VSEGAWGSSWGVSWGPSWGKSEISQQLDNAHSGVTRLWMYDLYEAAIQEDLKKKQEKELPVPVAVQPAPIKATQRRARRRTVKLEPKRVHKPIPHYAPAFVKPIESPSISEYLAELSPLPVLKDYIKETAVAKARKAKRKRKQEEELLLLLAA